MGEEGKEVLVSVPFSKQVCTMSSFLKLWGRPRSSLWENHKAIKYLYVHLWLQLSEEAELKQEQVRE